MYIKAYFLNNCSTTKLSLQIKTVNSQIKHKLKTISDVIRNLVLDFVTAPVRKYPMHVRAQGTTQNTLYIT